MDQALDIDRCDLECKVNNADHRTDLNGMDRLIVRRGQPFTITLHLRPGSQFIPEVIKTFALIAKTGPIPSVDLGTKSRFGLSVYAARTRWSASAYPTSGDTISLTVCSAPDAPIGLYTLTLDQGSAVSLGEFVLLFNPWCRRDTVYMDDEDKRQEYVLSQDGLIYQGSPTRIKVMPWTFGQFESGLLDICLKILDENPKYVIDAEQDCSARRDPVYVTRVLSAMINSSDDKGVLLGNWSGDYSDGVTPSKWRDSVAILHEWGDNVCQRVRYGQCWVFAAVACTVSRALGIPCRVVTNFGSAHDTNGNLVIEYLYDLNDENIHDDSIWNFHVWVESWMTRPDLKLGFEGWQASDPTPQEKSDGVYCCGPVPVRAIKEGELTLKYDAPFVYAEVNADEVEYIKLSDGRMVKMSQSSTEVGQCISTKAVGSDNRHDITHLYKYPEGSLEERKVYEKANHHNKLAQTGAEPGLHIKIKLSSGTAMGSDFDVSAIVTNNTPVPKTCRLMFYAYTVAYNGKLGTTCGLKDITDMQVSTGEEKNVSLRVEYSKYSSTITTERLIRLVARLFDSSTMEFHKATKTIVLDNPVMMISIVGVPKVNQKLTADITLENPLPEPLENCSFSVRGANLTDGKTITQTVGPVGPKQYATAKVEFTPTMAGRRKLLVDFNSDKLSNITGYKSIVIE